MEFQQVSLAVYCENEIPHTLAMKALAKQLKNCQFREDLVEHINGIDSALLAILTAKTKYDAGRNRVIVRDRYRKAINFIHRPAFDDEMAMFDKAIVAIIERREHAFDLDGDPLS